MLVQVDALLEKGHPYSEIANESDIEAVDSLNSCMRAREMAYMVGGRSTNARLGARERAARFGYTLHPAVLRRMTSRSPVAGA